MKLSDAIAKYENAEFKYGELDCCLFVANVIRDMTGKDYAATWRGRYHTEIGALRMIAEYGSLLGIAQKAFGFIKPFWCVKPGDPVMLHRSIVEHDLVADALGIFDGNQIVYMTEKGLARAPISLGRGCFNV